jgi:hypothetical protein
MNKRKAPRRQAGGRRDEPRRGRDDHDGRRTETRRTAGAPVGAVPSWESLFSQAEAMYITVTLKCQGRAVTYWLVDSARGLPTPAQLEWLLRREPPGGG